MKDLEKVNGAQLISFWKNISVGILVLILTLVFSRIFPFYFSPIIGLLAAAFLYTILYNNKVSRTSSCMVVPYAMFYCIIVYAFVSIILNVLDIWDFIRMPKEFSFFNDPYIPVLILDPICFFILLIIYIRRNRLAICIDCKISKGLSIERGKLGEILNVETRLQLLNLIWIFGLLSAVTWIYYAYFYFKGANVNNRDWYIFVWSNVIIFIIDEIYFASRYYNIYLDLKENGEIITEEELNDMTTKTYLRFYLICGNKVYLNTHVADPYVKGKFVTDTPFVTKRNVNGITISDVNGIIRRMTGYNTGELRFFYGRKSQDITKHRILRYFYFLDGKPEDYPELEIEGEWIDFDTLKFVYQKHPKSMSMIFLTDLSRMATIILTQKIFDDNGYRKLRVKSYRPTFDLVEVRDKEYDFQDDKWLRIAMFNSDLRGFHIRKWFDKFRRHTRRNDTNKKNPWQQSR
ncbi:MAG: hypothetical protein K2G67_03130 [Muribaculaceae bacterium]|nr:hypothetical protein [Muribaculaceae bacterium]